MDRIDERNRKAEIAKSVIKRHNIIYGAPQEIHENVDVKFQGQDEDKDKILARFYQERQDIEKQKLMEIERMVKEQEEKQIEVKRILNEKQEILEHTMEQASSSEQ